VELQTLRLMNRQHTDNVSIRIHDLCFGLADGFIMRAITKVANYVVQCRCSLPRQFAGYLDQFSDIRNALRTVALRHHHDIEIRSADDVLENFRSSRSITHLDPRLEDVGGTARITIQ